MAITYRAVRSFHRRSTNSASKIPLSTFIRTIGLVFPGLDIGVMPRLGEDANVATAYSGRGQSNGRGGWRRQMLVTGIGTFLLLIIMHNVLRRDYKVDTSNSIDSCVYVTQAIVDPPLRASTYAKYLRCSQVSSLSNYD